MLDNRYLGELYHYGVLGMKWGVRRSPDQLGAEGGNGTTKVEKSEHSVKMNGEYCESEKGYFLHPNKINRFCLKPGAKHADDFFEVGYKENDFDKLYHDIESGYDISKRVDVRRNQKTGAVEYSIPMMLGVDMKRTFRTNWCEDGPGGAPKFIGAYRDNELIGKV